MAVPVGMDICTAAPVGTVTAVAGGMAAIGAMAAHVGDGPPLAGFGFAVTEQRSKRGWLDQPVCRDVVIANGEEISGRAAAEAVSALNKARRASTGGMSVSTSPRKRLDRANA